MRQTGLGWLVASIEEFGFKARDTLKIQGRQARLAAIPDSLSSRVSEELRKRYPYGLYSHQAAAISHLLNHEDVCLATATASGKSLAFMTVAAHLVASEPSTTVLALYPAKALIQDQLAKWNDCFAVFAGQVEFIDGSVPVKKRVDLLRTHRVVLMTPDVAHAWLMSNLHEEPIRTFLSNLGLLILDEAHVYEGAFGTNMAYFMRRFQVAAKRTRLICCTATIGEPAALVQALTGRQVRLLAEDADGAEAPTKTLLLAEATAKRSFDACAELIRFLAENHEGRFLAFGDSRKAVERMVAAANRREQHEPAPDSSPRGQESGKKARHDAPHGGASQDGDYPVWPMGVLPYRAGYETDDRNAIQTALVDGRLRGVVSTSALELGLDIGDIDLVLLLGIPPTMKSFWQRVGRAGRRAPGTAVLIDLNGTLDRQGLSLRDYLNRSMETNWLYLDNKYIQYSNSLCAALELSSLGRDGEVALSDTALGSLPEAFLRLLENERNPTEAVSPDLYPLKQRAQAGPHREFPLRSVVEKDFKVQGPTGSPLGNVTFSQLMREAYPGAIYYYMARPFRVYQVNYRTGDVRTIKEQYYTTRPLAQAMVFPKFFGGEHQLYSNPRGFVAEVEMQVSERVLGFQEMRGSNTFEHRYEKGSAFSERELNRFFETSGVCWYFDSKICTSDKVAEALLGSFCRHFGIQERDLGVGLFHAKRGPTTDSKCQGACIFDATNGSLRLSQRLASEFTQVVQRAIAEGNGNGDEEIQAGLQELLSASRNMTPQTVAQLEESPFLHDEAWMIVIADDQPAVYHSVEGPMEVTVVSYRYTPGGLMYELNGRPHGVSGKWMVSAKATEAINGRTQMVRVNLVTGETAPVD